ncbi:MAG: ABC transporter substrate-binding protein, partial [Alphaproteobacteria bacterium]
MKRRSVLTLLGLMPLAAVPRMRALAQYVLPPLQEAPALAARVAAGTLPPLAARLPRNPAIALFDRPGQTVGRYGGDIVTLMARAQDVRLMFVYGYARLVRFDHHFDLVPDILESVEVQEGRVFTLRLREGHRWSDGQPFTAEDFRYFWEDVANDAELRPTGPPEELRVRGKLPAFAVLDAWTVRYAWEEPNPTFLTALAGAAPLLIYRPAHYLRRFHKRHADPAALDAMVKAEGVPFWAALHNKRDNQYRFDNPELPTLQPWIGITAGPSERFLFERNPYFHRVDPEGRQLPYVDRWVM